MKILIFIIFFLNIFQESNAQNDSYREEPAVLNTEKGQLKGTLLVPENLKNIPVVLIISGSGPTDRDGNNVMMKNNSLKYLAEDLAGNGIASLRYDKRGVGESKPASIPEVDLKFGNFVDDAVGWVKQLKNDGRFNRVYILGHSEGSLIGILAAQQVDVQGFISVAGAGESADKLISEQLKSQPDTITKMADPILHDLIEGKTVNDIPPILFSLFRPSIQPYLISWFQYNPAEEISELSVPSLIIQGNRDIQVSVEDARKLAAEAKHPELVIVDGMNHVLKESGTERLKNLATYNNPDLPVAGELISSIVKFIKH